MQITPTPTREIAPTTTDEAGVVHGTATNEGTLSEDTDDDNQNVHIEAEAPTDAVSRWGSSDCFRDTALYISVYIFVVRCNPLLHSHL